MSTCQNKHHKNLAAMSWKLEGVHVGFIRQITGRKAKRQRDRIWRSEAAEKVLKEAVTQSLRLYIEKWQANLAEWVALRKILEICDKETGYEGGGGRREPWWRQMEDRKQLGEMLNYI